MQRTRAPVPSRHSIVAKVRAVLYAPSFRLFVHDRTKERKAVFKDNPGLRESRSDAHNLATLRNVRSVNVSAGDPGN